MPSLMIDDSPAVEVESGKKLVLAIEDAGTDILHRCGGVSKCTTCRVQLISGHLPEMNELEKERLSRDGTFGPDIRLSCQVRVEGDVSVKVISRASETGLTVGNRPID